MKRLLVSLGLVIMATISGVAFSLNPNGATALPDNRYVALGDSVAAGLGLSGSAGDATCGTSSQSYAYKVAQSQGLTLEHVACSGAKADEGLYGPQEVKGVDLVPQLDQAFAPGVPQVMTITIGANDLRWSQFVRDCYVWNCGSSWDNVRAQAYLLDLRWELYQTFKQIESRSNGVPPQVYVTGYFDPVAGQTCAALPRVTATESAWLSNQVNQLNQVIRESTAGYDFTTYVPVSFAGHELCAAEPWVQGMNDAAPVHPTANGQAAIADAVIAAMGRSGSADPGVSIFDL